MPCPFLIQKPCGTPNPQSLFARNPLLIDFFLITAALFKSRASIDLESNKIGEVVRGRSVRIFSPFL